MSISSFSATSSPGAILLRTFKEEMTCEIEEEMNKLGPHPSRACLARVLLEAEKRRIRRLEDLVRQTCDESPQKSAPKGKKQSLLLPASNSLYHTLRKRNSTQLGTEVTSHEEEFSRLQKALSALQLHAEESDSEELDTSSSESKLSNDDIPCLRLQREVVSDNNSFNISKEKLVRIMMQPEEWKTGIVWPIEQLGNILADGLLTNSWKKVSLSENQLILRSGRLDYSGVCTNQLGSQYLIEGNFVNFHSKPANFKISVRNGDLRISQEHDEQAVVLRSGKQHVIARFEAVKRLCARDDAILLGFSEDSFMAHVRQGPFGAFVRIPLNFNTGLRLEPRQVFRIGCRNGLAVTLLSTSGGSKPPKSLLEKSLLHFHCFEEKGCSEELSLSFSQHTGAFIVLETLRFHWRYGIARIRQRWVLFGSSSGIATPKNFHLPPNIQISFLSSSEFALHSGPAPATALSARELLQAKAAYGNEAWLGLECLEGACFRWDDELMIGSWKLKFDCREFNVLKNLV